MLDKVINWLRTNTFQISCFVWVSILSLLVIHVLTNTIDPLYACVVLLILDSFKDLVL